MSVGARGKGHSFMIRWKASSADDIATSELTSDGEDKLLLIDDATFVSAFASATGSVFV